MCARGCCAENPLSRLPYSFGSSCARQLAARCRRSPGSGSCSPLRQSLWTRRGCRWLRTAGCARAPVSSLSRGDAPGVDADGGCGMKGKQSSGGDDHTAAPRAPIPHGASRAERHQGGRDPASAPTRRPRQLNKVHHAPFPANWVLGRRARRYTRPRRLHLESIEHGQVASKTATNADYSRKRER